MEVPAPPFWLSAPAYWVPEHFPPSAWVTHAPFASWLVDVVRPSRIVELGTHYGYSCFAFAEAVKRLGLDTTISALDSWEGDDHAGHYGDEVHEYVASVAAADYPDSVRLVRGWFSQSRPLFADASIDVLHIDGRHAYEDVLTDYSQWRGTVADGGVILFHDIAERENGFGVWRLWEDIAEPGRSFTFTHGHGLGVLAVGRIRHPRLQELFDADEVTATRVRADFERLGESIAHRVRLEALEEELAKVWAEVRSRALHEDQLEAELRSQLNEMIEQDRYINALKASRSWRMTAPLRALGKLRPRRG